MKKRNRNQLEALSQEYPDDPTRQIALYVRDREDIPDEDRLCASGILSALDAAEHARDLTVVEVGKWQLLASAAADAGRLWDRYGDRELLNNPEVRGQ